MEEGLSPRANRLGSPKDVENSKQKFVIKTVGIVKSVVNIYFNEDFEHGDCSEYEEYEDGPFDASTLTLNKKVKPIHSQEDEDLLPTRVFHPDGSDMDIAIKNFEMEIENGFLETDCCPKRTKSSRAQWTVVDNNRIPSKLTTTDEEEDNRKADQTNLEEIVDLRNSCQLWASKNGSELENSKQGHGDAYRDFYRRYYDEDEEEFFSKNLLTCSDAGNESLIEYDKELYPYPGYPEDDITKCLDFEELEEEESDEASTTITPEISIIYKKPDIVLDTEEDQEDIANLETLDFIQSIVRKRLLKSDSDHNFLNYGKESLGGDLGFRESSFGRESQDTFASGESSVYDERFIGRTDIFRPMLTPEERKMLGIAVIPDLADMYSESGSGNVEEFEDRRIDSLLNINNENEDIDAPGLPINCSRKCSKPQYPQGSNFYQLSTSTDTTLKHPPSLYQQHKDGMVESIQSIISEPDNKSDLKKAKNRLIKTIKSQSKLDKKAGNKLWKSTCEGRISTVRKQYKCFKEIIKNKTREESVRKLSLELELAQEDLEAKFKASKEAILEEFTAKVTKLSKDFQKNQYNLGEKFRKKLRKF